MVGLAMDGQEPSPPTLRGPAGTGRPTLWLIHHSPNPPFTDPCSVQSGASADEVLGEAEDARGLYQEAEDILGEAVALKMMVDCNMAKQDAAPKTSS